MCTQQQPIHRDLEIVIDSTFCVKCKRPFQNEIANDHFLHETLLLKGLKHASVGRLG
jgi:hypothetical protein